MKLFYTYIALSNSIRECIYMCIYVMKLMYITIAQRVPIVPRIHGVVVELERLYRYSRIIEYLHGNRHVTTSIT